MAENSTGSHLNAGDAQALDKRLAAKKLIEQYYFQLTQGCGNPNCTNEHCASSRKTQNLTPDEAAARALDLFARRGRLCVIGENSSQKTDKKLMPLSTSPGTEQTVSKDELWVPQQLHDTAKATTQDKSGVTKLTKLTEETFKEIIEDCKATGSYAKLVHTLGHIFANPEYLSQSFVGPNNIQGYEVHRQLSKEQLRSMEIDLDKDKDCQEASQSSSLNESSSQITVDVGAVRRSFEALGSIELRNYESALVHALINLFTIVELDLKCGRVKPGINLLNVFVIIFELPWLGSGDFLESGLYRICRSCALLPISQQAALVRFWAVHSVSNLRNVVQSVQQLISFRVLIGNYGTHSTPNYGEPPHVNDDDIITACVKVMRIFYCVNVFASTSPSTKASITQELMETDDQTKDSSSQSNLGLESRVNNKSNKTKKTDALFTELGISVLDCRKPVVPFSEFYNEPLSDVVEMDRDFAYFAGASEQRPMNAMQTSFMNFPFILTPAAKSLGLYYDNRIRMYSERRQSILERVLNGQPTDPYLKLRIRREHVVNDALNGLDMIASENPSDLKKQLVVEFEGEQGIDEGGLSKEFFQLVIEEVFNPDYAMFSFNSETRNFWFNPTSFESDAQFTLIGIMLGLAIYNTVILDVHFPMVVYRKLLGRKGNFEDLQELDPTLYKGLKELLEYSEPDIEETFMQTFNISYKDVFGDVYHHDLKENGASCCVNHQNKHEFVELYADFLLNECVNRQFNAFRRGFAMVTDESPLDWLFRPEEVEQLVCGSQNFDFEELQNATEYDGGFSAQSDTIKHFWSVVHEMSIEDKKRLLQFTTGSDRVPVGGLGRLKLIIARNGGDSDRLPMAHTCYNVLLLPEYGSQGKLKERLMKAIDYSKGFGML